MLRFFRTLDIVVKAAGLQYVTTVFGIMFVVCSVLVTLSEPEINSLGDAMWYCFTAVTTIGFGDYAAVTPVGRLAVVVLSLFSIFYLAGITGAFVTFVSDILRQDRDASLVKFMDQLEHLTELSPAELEGISAKVRDFRKEHKDHGGPS